MAEGEETMDSSENSQEHVDQKAKRIMKIFGQIAECLGDEEVANIKEMLSKIIDLCTKKEKNAVEHLNKLYNNYMLMVEFRAGISVTLIKLSIQSFLMIENDPEVLGNKVNDMFYEMIITEHPNLAMDMELTDELLKTYFRLLSEGGSEPALHIRIMIVGMFGVGKTSLRRRLCHQDVRDVKSTEGIDIYMSTCEVDEEKDGEWIISPDKEREQVFNARLQNLLEKYKKRAEKKDTQTGEEFEAREQRNTEQSRQSQKKRPENSQQEFRKGIYEEFRIKVDGKDLKNRVNKMPSAKIIRRPTISIWDFAGQSVYYSTHHFFLNERSIYLLVMDLSKDLDCTVEDNSMMFLPNFMIGNKQKFTCLEAFKFWIKSIYIYTKQKKMHSENESGIYYSPKIVLIGTHKDAITEKKLNGMTYEQYKDNYFDKALKSFTKRPMEGLVHSKKYLVNNLLPSKEESLEFLRLKSDIFNIAKDQTPFLNEPIPAKFIPLEREVFHSKTENKQIMRFEELQDINKKIELPSDGKEIEVFLAFQHAFGNVVHFNTETLRNTVILTPQWIIDVFKTFISHKTDKELLELDKWDDFKDHGILRKELIDELLKQREDLHQFRDQIVGYMEHMDVIVRPIAFQDRKEEPLDCDVNAEKTLEDFYIMPCMLPRIPELVELKECFKLDDKESTTPTLCLYFKQCFLPPFVVHCLLASFVKKMEIKTLNGKRMLYNGLGSFTFKDKEDRYLTIWCFEDILHFKINFIGELSAEEKTKFCFFWREEIEKVVLQLFNFHGKKTYTRKNSSTLFEYRIKCPKCDEQMPCEVKDGCDYMCGLFNLSDLIQRKYLDKKCSSCGRVTAVEKVLKDWFPNSQVVDIDPRLKESPEEDKLADLSKKIPVEFIKVLAVELSINEKVVEHLDAQRTPTEDPCHFIYHVLYQWKARDEIWNVLYVALSKVGIDISEDFFKIIKGEERSDILEKIENNMKTIGEFRQKKTGNTLAGRVLEERELACLADSIGNEFWSLGVRLGVSDVTIQQLMVKFKNDCKKVNLEILREWNKSGADLKDLIKAMVKSGTDMQRVRKTLKAYYTS